MSPGSGAKRLDDKGPLLLGPGPPTVLDLVRSAQCAVRSVCLERLVNQKVKKIIIKTTIIAASNKGEVLSITLGN